MNRAEIEKLKELAEEYVGQGAMAVAPLRITALCTHLLALQEQLARSASRNHRMCQMVSKAGECIRALRWYAELDCTPAGCEPENFDYSTRGASGLVDFGTRARAVYKAFLESGCSDRLRGEGEKTEDSHNVGERSLNV